MKSFRKETKMNENNGLKTTTPKGKADQSPTKTYFEAREAVQQTSKLAVAKFIVENFLHEGDSILLDAGTSLYPIAQEIAIKAQQEPEITHFTIITHNYKAFQILVDQVPREAMVNIVLAGGRYDRDLNALFGPQTIMAYDNFFPRVVLIGISGMVADHGLFCHGNTEELAVKEVIFRKGARDRIIVADHTKLGVPDALCFGASQQLRASVENCIVVTDEPRKDADKQLRERFQREQDRLASVYEVKVKMVPVGG